tara:strand:+ start:4251 stop:6158 length:1908 start_codon:yes stop_codon:yes gene_type:complete
MQYYLNGFTPRNPNLAKSPTLPHRPELPTHVDVLIIGSGPAGLTIGAQLSAFSEISTVIIDQKNGPLQVGQADGIACRSVEMFVAFGFSERVLKEAYWVNEVSFWKPDDAVQGLIVRSGRILDVEDGVSEMPHVILSQARIHDFFLEHMRNGPLSLEPHYNSRFVNLARDDSADYPLRVMVECRSSDGVGTDLKTIRARYVVGCDGARSTVRKAIGRHLKGDTANQAWGVMDVLANTDFPDIRLKSVIHSAKEGSMLIIPREGGYLVRMYIELDKLDPGERIGNKYLTQDRLIAAARRIMAPYTLSVKEVSWWSVYEIGQRLCDRFDDSKPGAKNHGTEDAEQDARIFIAGDAGHTHSPKAGQGMNVSMGDGFNLGWKLAAVLRGQAKPSILATYSHERQALARELIDFDRDFAKMFSARPKTQENTDDNSVDPAVFQQYFQKQGRFTAGVSVRYPPSTLTGDGKHQKLAEGLTVGMRFHSAPVIRVADARRLHLGHQFLADGRWRLLLFAGRTEDLGALCEFLTIHLLRRFTPTGADIDAVIDMRAILQGSYRSIDLARLPPSLLPQKGRYGLKDYEKVFCADPNADIFSLRRIDREKGCLVIVRPDQYVAQVLPIDTPDVAVAYFNDTLTVPQ